MGVILPPLRLRPGFMADTVKIHGQLRHAAASWSHRFRFSSGASLNNPESISQMRQVQGFEIPRFAVSITLAIRQLPNKPVLTAQRAVLICPCLDRRSGNRSQKVALAAMRHCSSTHAHVPPAHRRHCAIGHCAGRYAPQRYPGAQLDRLAHSLSQSSS